MGNFSFDQKRPIPDLKIASGPNNEVSEEIRRLQKTGPNTKAMYLGDTKRK